MFCLCLLLTQFPSFYLCLPDKVAQCLSAFTGQSHWAFVCFYSWQNLISHCSVFTRQSYPVLASFTWQSCEVYLTKLLSVYLTKLRSVYLTKLLGVYLTKLRGVYLRKLLSVYLTKLRSVYLSKLLDHCLAVSKWEVFQDFTCAYFWQRCKVFTCAFVASSGQGWNTFEWEGCLVHIRIHLSSTLH